jgi:hypothetical protein
LPVLEVLALQFLRNQNLQFSLVYHTCHKLIPDPDLCWYFHICPVFVSFDFC